MKKVIHLFIISIAILTLLIISGCKTTDDTIAEKFSIETTSGYSLNATIIQNDKSYELTSINLYAAIRNHTDISGTITGWSFKIRRNIVTIVEINQDNYQNYKLRISGDILIPADEINEFFVGTPQPFLLNALPKEIFTFEPYIPTEVIAEIQITDETGTIHAITASGTYTYEETTINKN